MEKRFRNKIIIIIIIIKMTDKSVKFRQSAVWPHCLEPPRWPSGKASASRAEDPGFDSNLCRDFFGVESYQ